MEHKKITLNIGGSNNIKEKNEGDSYNTSDNDSDSNVETSELVSRQVNNEPQTDDYIEPEDETEKNNNISIASIERIKEDEEILDKYVDNFYSMKNDYETKKEISINRKKEEMITKGKPRHKIVKAISEMKHKCVNCSRQVNMYFSTKNNKLVAKCGSKESPCNLNISINKGKYYPYEKILKGTLDVKGLKNDIDEHKLSIIKMKLDMVFEFENIPNTLRKFNKIKGILADSYDNFQERNYAYVNTVDKYDETSLAELELKKEEIINSLKRTINDY